MAAARYVDPFVWMVFCGGLIAYHKKKSPLFCFFILPTTRYLSAMLRLGFFCFLAMLLLSTCSRSVPPPRVLVFSRTNPNGYRHQSIEAGKEALVQICHANGILADTTENQQLINEKNLRRYAAVVFLNTNGDVLDPDQECDFERYIQAGGGFVGVHAASACEYAWKWYGGLVGAYFKDHPAIQDARVQVADCAHAATEHLGCRDWAWREEWYNFRAYQPDLRVLLRIADSTYAGGSIPPDSVSRRTGHALAWSHAYDGGRAFYTSLGHLAESYADPTFRQHLLGGLRYAIGEQRPLRYHLARTPRRPDQSRFVKTVVADHLAEPMELAQLPTGDLLVIERHGYLRRYDTVTDQLHIAAKLDVYSEMGDGLLGLAVDPDWATNGWIYLYYSSLRDSSNQLSRFVFRHDTLHRATETVLLRVPVERHNTFHAAGSLEFGPDGYLYLATGDNTSPFASEGYAPTDERPGRQAFDAQRSSANPNDLRGKILRIKPLASGGYFCPKDNLFGHDARAGRPEIYVMGCRNPFRISVDQRRNYLYWGDIGPDAGKDDTLRGPRGHDEINQARQAGNYGWPHFVADNQAYRRYDFATQKSGPAHHAEYPTNPSPHNTGASALPPAQPAFIWYPYARNRDFTLLGEGGRNAMAGPTYYADQYPAATRWPAEYHAKTLVYDWMRHWIMAVTLDSLGQLSRIEPVADSVRLNRPMDMIFDQKGRLWVLEYGQRWYSSNDDARLSRIDWVRGNRPPTAHLRADTTTGVAPRDVFFCFEKCADLDDDPLTYELDFGDGSPVAARRDADFLFEKMPHHGQITMPDFLKKKALRDDEMATSQSVFLKKNNPRNGLRHRYAAPGRYVATLRVRDAQGAVATDSCVVQVGNAPPQVTWLAAGHNRSWYRPGDSLRYALRIVDAEDGTLESGISAQKVAVSFAFFEKNVNPASLPRVATGAGADERYARGRYLVGQSGCYNCHAVATAINGPAFMAVAERYRRNTDFAVAMIYRKIIYGGVGNWGQRPMSAHPHIREEDAIDMARWILALGDPPKPTQTLPVAGAVPLTAQSGAYVLRAAYTDAGASAMPPLAGGDVLVLRPQKMEAEWCDGRSVGVGNLRPYDNDTTVLTELKHNAWWVFRRVDVAGIQSVMFRLGSGDAKNTYCGGRVEVHLDRPDGPLWGRLDLPRENEPKGRMRWYERVLALPPTGRDGRYRDVFFVFKNEVNQGQSTSAVDWVRWGLGL
jgi:cytochrome c